MTNGRVRKLDGGIGHGDHCAQKLDNFNTRGDPLITLSDPFNTSE